MNWLTKDMAERALWTGAQALAGLAAVALADISAWWAAPIALAIAALKTYVIDKYAQRSAAKEAAA